MAGVTHSYSPEGVEDLLEENRRLAARVVEVEAAHAETLKRKSNVTRDWLKQLGELAELRATIRRLKAGKPW